MTPREIDLATETFLRQGWRVIDYGGGTIFVWEPGTEGMFRLDRATAARLVLSAQLGHEELRGALQRVKAAR